MTLCFCTGPCTAACCYRLQTFVHAITFQELFGFLSFFAQLLAVAYRLPGQILVIWFSTSSMNFQGQVWNLQYISKKWFDCHKTKSKHINWTLGLKRAHRVWPWPWNFKFKYGICYISAKNGPIAMKRKANILIDLKTSNVTIEFDLGHNLALEIARSNMEFAISQPKVVWLLQNEKQSYRLNTRPQMWPTGLTLAMTLTFEFSRSNVIFTVWWSRSGARIYQILTGWLQMLTCRRLI